MLQSSVLEQSLQHFLLGWYQFCSWLCDTMWWKVVLVVGLLGALAPICSEAHLISPGKCPDLKVKQNFDVHKYMGTWYGQYSFGTESTQGKGKCVTAIYNYNKTAGVVDIYNWQIPSPGYRSSINGTSVPMDPAKKEGKMKVTFHIAENRTKTFPLLVLDTDYKSWAVVYYCKTLLHHYETSGWVLTRAQDLDNSLDKELVERRVDEVLRAANISRSIYTRTVQRGCRPEPRGLLSGDKDEVLAETTILYQMTEALDTTTIELTTDEQDVYTTTPLPETTLTPLD